MEIAPESKEGEGPHYHCVIRSHREGRLKLAAGPEFFHYGAGEGLKRRNKQPKQVQGRIIWIPQFLRLRKKTRFRTGVSNRDNF